MKRFTYFLSVLTMVALVAISCNKDKDNEGIPGWTGNTVEEDKAALEQSSIEFVQEMGSMADEPAMEAVAQLASLMGQSGSSEGSMLKALTDLSQGKGSISNLVKAMQEGQLTPSEQDFENEKGLFTWNKLNESWDEATGNTVKYVFPASETATSNNASFEVTDFDMQYLTVNDVKDEVPVTIKAVLKVDNVAVMSYSFIATYTTDRPTSVVTTLTIGAFEFKAQASNPNNKNASIDYSFKHGSKVLISLGGAVTGNWNQDNIDANTTIINYSDEYNSWQEESVAADKIITNANAYFTLMNAKIVGTVNFAPLYKEMQLLDDEDLTEKEAADKEAALLAKYATLYMTIDGKLVAKVEPYTKDSYDPYWDETEYYVDFRLTFADGSPADLATYTGEGFNSLVTEINSFFADMNEQYDANLEPINYGTKTK